MSKVDVTPDSLEESDHSQVPDRPFFDWLVFFLIGVNFRLMVPRDTIRSLAFIYMVKKAPPKGVPKVVL